MSAVSTCFYCIKHHYLRKEEKQKLNESRSNMIFNYTLFVTSVDSGPMSFINLLPKYLRQKTNFRFLNAQFLFFFLFD